MAVDWARPEATPAGEAASWRSALLVFLPPAAVPVLAGLRALADALREPFDAHAAREPGTGCRITPSSRRRTAEGEVVGETDRRAWGVVGPRR